MSKVHLDHVPMIFDQILSFFHLWSEFPLISELFRVPPNEECLLCDKMTRTPGINVSEGQVKNLRAIVDGSGYFLWYGTEQSIVTYLY